MIKIELDELNGAFDGDLVIAKRVFNPKSKIKAKIIKIISSKKAEILVYVKDRAFCTVKENIRIENKKALTFNENDVLVVEMNLGQMYYEVDRAVNATVNTHLLGVIGGLLPTPEEILSKIESIILFAFLSYCSFIKFCKSKLN